MQNDTVPEYDVDIEIEQLNEAAACTPTTPTDY